MREIIDGLTHDAPAVGVVRRHLGHDEVALTERGALGVYAYEYVRDDVDIQIVGKLYHAYEPIGDRAQIGEHVA